MQDNQEIELKYQLTNPQIGEQIIQDPLIQGLCNNTPAAVRNYKTTYYDTKEHSLLAKRLCYRIRERDGEYIASIKGSGSAQAGLAIRNEWEQIIPDNKATLEPFKALSIGEELAQIIGAKQLYPLFTTHFQRTTLDLVTQNGSTVELAVDIGEIIAGKNRDPICELELELKSGLLDEMLQLGKELAQLYSLKAEEKSKFLRGLILIGRLGL